MLRALEGGGGECVFGSGRRKGGGCGFDLSDSSKREPKKKGFSIENFCLLFEYVCLKRVIGRSTTLIQPPTFVVQLLLVLKDWLVGHMAHHQNSANHDYDVLLARALQVLQT